MPVHRPKARQSPNKHQCSSVHHRRGHSSALAVLCCAGIRNRCDREFMCSVFFLSCKAKCKNFVIRSYIICKSIFSNCFQWQQLGSLYTRTIRVRPVRPAVGGTTAVHFRISGAPGTWYLVYDTMLIPTCSLVRGPPRPRVIIYVCPCVCSWLGHILLWHANSSLTL